MTARASVALLLAVALLGGGCAVGRFLTGAPDPSAATSLAAGHHTAAAATPAHVLLVRRCSGCHKTPDPATMTAAAWQAGLERMKLRMKLPASEWDSLATLAAEARR